ncbi:hypothetical protein [Streptomyces viridosporus]|uniref:hypothetical protein n=1 Tax=Streptomyces viridosporus TaxID=67581 RepID=UPI00332FE6C4
MRDGISAPPSTSDAGASSGDEDDGQDKGQDDQTMFFPPAVRLHRAVAPVRRRPSGGGQRG